MPLGRKLASGLRNWSMVGSSLGSWSPACSFVTGSYLAVVELDKPPLSAAEPVRCTRPEGCTRVLVGTKFAFPRLCSWSVVGKTLELPPFDTVEPLAGRLVAVRTTSAVHTLVVHRSSVAHISAARTLVVRTSAVHTTLALHSSPVQLEVPRIFAAEPALGIRRTQASLLELGKRLAFLGSHSWSLADSLPELDSWFVVGSHLVALEPDRLPPSAAELVRRWSAVC